MYFKQFYLNCLAHASYLIGSDGEAAVVDPQRDVDGYLKEAEARNLKIKYIIETHLHADFVSGHRELADRTGAEIVFGRQAGATFPHRAVKDGDELTVGRVKLKFLETPGHTPEGICVLLNDAEISGAKPKLLTGDTLFVGDVGRPDLAGGKGYTSEMMAGMMYDTLHEKLLQLPDDTEVWPAHGAGSMCGRSLSSETSSTIGEQKKFNYALKPMSKDEFVRMMTQDLPEAPQYFPRDAEINRTGAIALDDLPAPPALEAKVMKQLANEGATILDVRSSQDFGSSHIPGSINIGLGGQFAMWAGTLIEIGTPIVILAESAEKATEAVMRLARVGIETVQGYLTGGIQAWLLAGYEVASVPQISVNELRNLLNRESTMQVIDVRRAPEYASGHVPRAVTAPLASLTAQVPSLGLDPTRRTAVICAGGYRSSTGTSLLEQAGFENILNVVGGTTAWINAGFPVEIPEAAAAATKD